MVAVYSLTSGTLPCLLLRLDKKCRLVNHFAVAIHGWQMFRSRAWWLIPTVLVSCFAEVLGWAERLQSAFDPTARMPFIIQYVSLVVARGACQILSFDIRTSILVLAPTPLVAALFVGFGKIVDRLGAQYSRLKPKLCAFITSSIVGTHDLTGP